MKEVSGRWYLREWAKAHGKRQADLVKELGWANNTAHKLWHLKQHYSQKQIEQVSAWLGIRPHELLMLPAEALSLRRIRQAAEDILNASETGEVRVDAESAPHASVSAGGRRRGSA